MSTETTAFALGGAGTKGAFEMGALRYTVEAAGFEPTVITGASAGAIIGSVLAQARGRDELLAVLDELEADLLAMTDTSIVFAKQPWLAEFDGTPVGDAVDAFITVRTRPPVPSDPADPPAPQTTASAGKHHRRHHRGFHDLTTLVTELTRAMHSRKMLPGHASSLLTLDPLDQALRGNGPSAFTPLDPTRVARPGLELRLAITPLRAGVTHYVTGDGTIVEADARTPLEGAAAGPIDLIDGVLASSSVPMIFPPRPLGTDTYIDGGVLQNVPVEAAAALGASRIVGVLGVPTTTAPDLRDPATLSFVDVHLRAGLISFAETQRRNIDPRLASDAEVIIIAPTLDVVGPFEVAQGLMLLDMDYGWLRGGDVLDELDADARAAAFDTSDAITAARERAWYLEEELWAAHDADTDRLDRLDRLRRIKAEVADALDRRRVLGAPTPSDADRWAEDWEHHTAPRPEGLPDTPA